MPSLSKLSGVEVEVPGDLTAALRNRENARNTFNELPASHRQDIIDWLEAADDPRHRTERLLMIVDVLLPRL